MRFFVGLHQPSDAKHLEQVFISVNRLRTRKKDFIVRDWIMDCGGFTEILRHGGYRHPVSEYAAQIHRWKTCGRLLAAVSQDYMCEPHMLKITGMTVKQHQRLTIQRYDALLELVSDVYILPVLQGYQPEEYVEHIQMYGARLAFGAWVGVGSVCKRNSNPCEILDVLLAIKRARPDIGIHGFGMKSTSLSVAAIRDCMKTGDSMSWSYNARRNGRNGNDWKEAHRFWFQIQHRGPSQRSIYQELYAEIPA